MKLPKLLCLLIFSTTYGQSTKQAPNYEQIKFEIENANSKSFYPKLIARLHDNDTTLTNSDFRNLYYGYTLQKEYNPRYIDPNDKELQKYFRSDNITPEDCDKFILLANSSLKKYPFDLRILNLLAYVYHLKGDNNMADKVSHSFQGLIGAIFSSGDGFKCETAFHVISVNHEYVMLNMLELSSVSQSLIGNCDFLAFEKGEYKIDGLYFDVSQLFAKY